MQGTQQSASELQPADSAPLPLPGHGASAAVSPAVSPAAAAAAAAAESDRGFEPVQQRKHRRRGRRADRAAVFQGSAQQETHASSRADMAAAEPQDHAATASVRSTAEHAAGVQESDVSPGASAAGTAAACHHCMAKMHGLSSWLVQEGTHRHHCHCCSRTAAFLSKCAASLQDTTLACLCRAVALA